MNFRTRSHRIVEALKDLSQFQATSAVGPAICSLSGVHVEPSPDPLGVDHGKIVVTFPGAKSFEASGEPFLEVQMRESIRTDLVDADVAASASQRLNTLRNKLRQKHDL